MEAVGTQNPASITARDRQLHHRLRVVSTACGMHMSDHMITCLILHIQYSAV